MTLDRQSKQAIGVMLGLIGGTLVGVSIISPKYTPTELRIKEVEYFEHLRAADAEKDRLAMQAPCQNDDIKAVSIGLVVTCKYGMWAYPQFAGKPL